MELFERIRSSFQPNLDLQFIKKDVDLRSEQVRLLVYRECDRRGRKCLYDSDHVIQDKMTYIYTKSKDDFSEIIFGSVPISESTRRFHSFESKLIWSFVFSSPYGKVTTLENNSSRCTGSMPSIVETEKRDFKNCKSLPARLGSRTLLGIAIVVSLTSLTPSIRVTSLSNEFESALDWFSSITAKAYSTPSKFVETLYNFCFDIRVLLSNRINSSLVYAWETPSFRSLLPFNPEILSELLRSFFIFKRPRLVFVGTRKNEIYRSFIHIFRFLCSCRKRRKSSQDVEEAIEQSIELSPKSSDKSFHFNFNLNVSDLSPSSSSCREEYHLGRSGSGKEKSSVSSLSASSFSSSSGFPSFALSEPSESGMFGKRCEKDSGIELSFESMSSSSQRDGGFVEEESDEEVTFHLGDKDTDKELTFNNLILSEPKTGRLSFIEPVNPLTTIETLYDPIHVQINFSKLKNDFPVRPCGFCDSIAAGTSFNPFFAFQLVPELSRESQRLMNESKFNFIVINLEKRTLNCINIQKPCDNGGREPFDHLIDKFFILVKNSKDEEVEEFFKIQAEFLQCSKVIPSAICS